MKCDLRSFMAMRFFPVVTIALLLSHNAGAAVPDDDTLIEGAKLCTSYLPRHERAYGIPVHLLAAIATTESGRYNKAIGLSLPWPWTINVEGKGYYYNTKEEAVTAVRDLQKRGFQSIDVGCMQVNLRHHPNAFANIEQAFDPAYNIAYAAQFLKQNFQGVGSWRKATADYHSRTPVFGNQYANLVFNSWSRIINKVAEARSGKVTLQADASQKTPMALASAGTRTNARTPARHSYQALRMHSISVSRDTSTEKGVLVIRPDHNEAVKDAGNNKDEFVSINIKPKAAAQQTSTVASNTTDNGNKAKVIKLQGSSAKGQFTPSTRTLKTGLSAETTSRPSGSNSVFVFDN